MAMSLGWAREMNVARNERTPVYKEEEDMVKKKTTCKKTACATKSPKAKPAAKKTAKKAGKK
jgi:hypothetical protein